MLANVCCGQDVIMDWITIVIEFVGLILVLYTLRKDKKIKEAEFITEYNFHFISSQPLVDMERKLESCYQKYDDIEDNLDTEEGFQKAWDTMTDILAFQQPSATQGNISRSYQKLINYLVYWEAFAPLILSEQVKLDVIDDAFGYRYFIAMNNPVVQKCELLKESEYYCGCICLYKKWYTYREEHGKDIPMDKFALCLVKDDEKKKTKMNPIYKFNCTEPALNETGDELLKKYTNIIQKNSRFGRFWRRLKTTKNKNQKKSPCEHIGRF